MFDEPIQLWVTPGDPITVREAPLKDGLGYFDESTFEIVINSGQSEAGKFVILLHELLHASETAMVQWGVAEDKFDEAQIQAMSMFLSTALVRLGLVESVDEEVFDAFLTRFQEESVGLVETLKRVVPDVEGLDEDSELLHLADEGGPIGILSKRTDTFYPSDDIDPDAFERYTLAEVLGMFEVTIADVWYYRSQEYVDEG